MKNNFRNLLAVVGALVFFSGCEKTNYEFSEPVAPDNIVITAEVIGQSAAQPYGDSSGLVKITVTSNNTIAYKLDYDASTPQEYESISNSGIVTNRFSKIGLHTYTITALALGAGGIVSATATKDVTVYFKYEADTAIVRKLTNNSSKTWKVDSTASGHLGVGPYDVNSIKPEWWAAGVNEKASCCMCFYTAAFTFTQTGDNFSLQTATPDGAFTKTGSLTTLPGIPGTGDEGCYPYAGGSSSFQFLPASSGAPRDPVGAGNVGSTQTSIVLSGNNTFIGYGAVKKEYEILSIDETTMHLRVQGTETGNAWYIRLKAQ